MKRYLALLIGMFGAAGLVACSRQPPSHTADDSSWVRPQASAAPPAEPAQKAADLKQALSEQPSPWAPPKTSEAVVPTSMNKAPPATEAPGLASPPVPNGMPQPDAL
ncbi:MAG: hypothetical protein EOO73_30360 [Myxococcales bacterium]|nr:MAG: hypothetical protein EOO73_30360 [Myxococcales bacterium]